jgi:hypothetical protein
MGSRDEAPEIFWILSLDRFSYTLFVASYLHPMLISRLPFTSQNMGPIDDKTRHIKPPISGLISEFKAGYINQTQNQT